MPRVPIVDSRQIASTPLQGGAQQAPDIGAAARALTGGLNVATEVLDKVVERNDNNVAWQTEANIKTEFAKFDQDLRKQSQGRNAIGYAEKVNQWWTDQSKLAGNELTPAQREKIGRSLTVAQTQSFQGALGYQNEQLEKSEAESFVASQLAEVQRASASGNPAVAAVSSQLLRDRNAQMAVQKGWTPERLADANMKATTALHANMIQGLQQRDPAAALAYFNANKGEIDGTRHAEIEHSLTAANAANDGDQAAQKLWGEHGPKSYNEPVLLDKMAEEARALYLNDPVRRKAAIDALKERAATHNVAQAENNAAATNAVMQVYNQTKNLAAMKRSPAWGALPASEQAKIEQYVEGQQYSALLRVNAAEARQDAAEVRAQRKLGRDAAAAYLVYSNPTVLNGMSEAQVQALLPVLGEEKTTHLMEKKRSTKTPAGEADAKMDKQDFDHIADQMGLKPFAKKSDEEKANLGELQYRVEQMVYSAQQAKGKPLTREEKSELMRQEMARTVKLGRMWPFSDEDRPVIALKPDEIADVVVPRTDRLKIIDALARRYKTTPIKEYEPTEANVRRLYLEGRSRAAALLPQEK